MVWTEAKEQFLRENYRARGASDIALKLNTTRNSVIGKARRMGLALQTNVPRSDGWTQYQLETMRRLYGVIPLTDLAIKVHRSFDAVVTKAGEIGLRRARSKPSAQHRHKLSTARAS